MPYSRKDRLEIERKVRDLFNEQKGRHAEKLPRRKNELNHEFDLYERSKVIGGITTSPWWNKTKKHSSNSGGQDRASTELLWLTMWGGNEQRVMICTERDMAENLCRRWRTCPFLKKIEIVYCDLSKKRDNFKPIGILGS